MIIKLCLLGSLANALEIGPYESIEESYENTWYPQDANTRGLVDAPFVTRFVQLGQEFTVGPAGLEVVSGRDVFAFQTLAYRLVLGVIKPIKEQPRSLAILAEVEVCRMAVSFVSKSPDSNAPIRVKAYSIEGSLIMDATVEDAWLLEGEDNIRGFTVSTSGSAAEVAGLQISAMDGKTLRAVTSITVDTSCTVMPMS